jgi:anti-sigma regulatory factor (Ser/Thr protein kinase)
VTANRLHTSLPARPDSIGEFRRAVVEYARRVGASQVVAQAVRLAVSEALTNVAMHAYRGRKSGDMVAEAWAQDEDLLVRVWDDGVGLIPRPDSPGMGIGVAVMAQAADEFTISHRDGVPGTLVELRFALARVGVSTPASS